MPLFRSRAAVAVLSLACAIQTPAHASNDGKLCDGLAIVVCVPVAVIASVAKALTPKSKEDKLAEYATNGDLEQVKRLLRKDGEPDQDEMLRIALRIYLYQSAAPELEAKRFAIAEYMAGQFDLSGKTGTDMLQMAVEHERYSGKAEAQASWPRRVALARLLLSHGASAKDVNLAQCGQCDADNEFLPLLVSHGANPNDVAPGTPALLNQFMLHDKFEAAKRLVDLGADANGSATGARTLLVDIASECDREQTRKYNKPEEFEQAWQECVGKTRERTAYFIAHGADPNGKVGPANHCSAPYEVARAKGNTELAELLLKLGADPGSAERCRQTLPATAKGADPAPCK